MPHLAGPRYPWGQEAFDKARKENKPIFLSGNVPTFSEMGGGVMGKGWSVGERSCEPCGLSQESRDQLLVPEGPGGSAPSLLPLCVPVGYSTCHWCHMMEEESFQNEEIGRLLSEDFISVKVDREERPDVDKVFMTFVQVSCFPVGERLHLFAAVPLTLMLSPPGYQQWWGLAHECVADSQSPALCGGHLFPP